MSYGFSLKVILHKLFIYNLQLILWWLQIGAFFFLQIMLILDQSLSVSHSCIILFFPIFLCLLPKGFKEATLTYWFIHILFTRWYIRYFLYSSYHTRALKKTMRHKIHLFHSKMNIKWVIKTNIEVTVMWKQKGLQNVICYIYHDIPKQEQTSKIRIKSFNLDLFNLILHLRQFASGA